MSRSLHTNRDFVKDLSRMRGNPYTYGSEGGRRAVMPLTYPIDRPTCNSVTDAELGQVMRLPNISPGTTWM